MPRVFIPQVPHKRDRESNSLVPAFDITPAKAHGDLIVMVPLGTNLFNTQELVRVLVPALTTYDWDAGDCLLAIGDPIAIAACGAILGAMHRRIRLIKWDRISHTYVPATIAI